MKIRLNSNGNIQTVTAEQWETINSNPLLKGKYTVISKDEPTKSAELPDELIPEQYRGKTLEELKELADTRELKYPKNAKEKKLIEILMEADKQQ